MRGLNTTSFSPLSQMENLRKSAKNVLCEIEVDVQNVQYALFQQKFHLMILKRAFLLAKTEEFYMKMYIEWL